MYESGSLHKSLQDLLVTKEINELAEEEVNLDVFIDQDSYNNACRDLLIQENKSRF